MLTKNRSIVRAFHSSWDDEQEMRPKQRYMSCITLEPQEALSAWDRLSEDTVPLEFANWPRLLHAAFLRELTKRSANGR